MRIKGWILKPESPPDRTGRVVMIIEIVGIIAPKPRSGVIILPCLRHFYLISS